MSGSESPLAVATEIEVEATSALQETEGTGRFRSIEALRAVHSWLLARHNEHGEDETVDNRQLLDDQERFLALCVESGKTLDVKADRREAQSLLDYWYTVLYRAGRRHPRPLLATLDEDLFPELEDANCPYLGLDAFREKDSRLFFGRERLLESLMEKLAATSLLAVVGQSGGGKSSVVQAGLVPALRAGCLPGSASWTILGPMVPGSDPLDRLAQLIPGHLDERAGTAGPTPQPWPPLRDAERLAETLRRDVHELRSQIDQPDSPPAVVVVDQFEEVFTLSKDPQAARAFIDNLVELVRTDDGAPPKHRVILAMRSDFEVHVVKHEKLRDLFEAGRVVVTPMERAELRDAIERPAQQVGLVFEEGVAQELLDETHGEPGALPLLQFALLKLWENRWHHKVRMQEYRRLGGIREALRTAADELYAHMIPENQQLARRIFLRIVRPGEGLDVTNKRVPMSELAPAGVEYAATREVLEAFIDARLLRCTRGQTDEDTQVEVAHEALVRNWPRLVEWLSDQRAAIVKRQRLEMKVAEWVRHGRGRAALLDSAQLVEAESWLYGGDAIELGAIPGLADLVEASRKTIQYEHQDDLARAEIRVKLAALLAARSRERAQRMVSALVAMTVGIVLCLSATFIAFRQASRAWQESDNAREQAGRASRESENARRAYARYVATRLLQAATQEGNSSERSLVLAQKAVDALQSRHLPITAEVARTLEGVARKPILEVPMSRNERFLVFYDPNGRLLATSTYGEDVTLWDADTGQKLWVLPGTARANDAVTTMAFSLDGSQLATADMAGRVKIWKIATPAAPRPQDSSADEFHGAVEQFVRSAVAPRPVVQTVGGSRRVAIYGVAFAPAANPSRVATAGENGTVIVWDGYTGKPVTRLIGHTAAVYAVAYAPDARRLATGGADGTARIWDAFTGARVESLDHPRAKVTAVAFHPDGSRLVTVCTDGHVCIWNVKDRTLLKSFDSGRVSWYGGVAVSRDGKLLATSGVDRTIVVKLWRIESGELQLPVTIGYSQASAVAFRPDLRRFAVATTTASAANSEAPSSAAIASGGDQPAFVQRQVVKIFEIRKIDHLLDSIRAQSVRDLSLEDYCEILKDLSPEDSEMMAEAGKLAQSDDVEGALAKVKDALELPGLDLNVDRESRRLVARVLMDQGCDLAKDGNREQAINLFRRAEAVDPERHVNPQAEASRCEALGWRERGRRLAAQGDYVEGAKLFRRALALDPQDKLDPDSVAKSLAAPAIFNRALQLVKAGKVQEALAAWHEAERIDPTFDIRSGMWNALCRWGSLHDKGPDVLFAGEQAVERAPEGEKAYYRDTRGLARALTGQLEAAKEDFQAYVDWAQAHPGSVDAAEIAERLRWIEELKAGRLPFNAAELQRLLKRDLQE